MPVEFKFFKPSLTRSSHTCISSVLCTRLCHTLCRIITTVRQNVLYHAISFCGVYCSNGTVVQPPNLPTQNYMHVRTCMFKPEWMLLLFPPISPIWLMMFLCELKSLAYYFAKDDARGTCQATWWYWNIVSRRFLVKQHLNVIISALD